jgi:hypothetical protein
LPPELENDAVHARRKLVVVEGEGEDVRLFRVSFTFGEILPNYPAPD